MRSTNNYNLIDLNDIKNKSLDDIKEFLIYNGAQKIDENDVKAISSFLELLYNHNRKGFVVSFVIEKLDKEFDLLKYGNNRIVNIEMKIKNLNEGLEQAKKNFKILSNVTDEVCIYLFIESTNKLYYYSAENKKLIESDKEKINEDLAKIINSEIPVMESILLNPYQYPEEFLNDNYVLSQSQQNIKDDILKLTKKIYAVEGSGGTGKTVLALDLYKELLKKYGAEKVSYLTPFAKKEIINSELTDKFKFQMFRYYDNKKKTKVIIVEEAQRLGKGDLAKLLKNTENVVLFYDKHQDIDNVNQINLFLEEKKDIISSYSLKYVMRNDSTFERFAKKICGFGTSDVKNKNFNPEKIEIYMYSEKEKYEKYNKVGKFIWCTQNKYGNKCETKCNNQKCKEFYTNWETNIVHFEISKDEKNVMLFLCEGFMVKENSIQEKYNICSGNVQKQLYSIITRATEKLIIICDDISMYNFCTRTKLNLKK